jgi:hypothetical protein
LVVFAGYRGKGIMMGIACSGGQANGRCCGLWPLVNK